MKGLYCFVYRSGLGDSTNGGVTSVNRMKSDGMVLLVGHGVHGPTTVEEAQKSGHPVLMLQPRNGIIRAIPYMPDNKENIWWMFGGNFIYSSDSRFPCVCNGSKYPIPVHDRRE